MDTKDKPLVNLRYKVKVKLWRTTVYFIVGDREYFDKQAYKICKFKSNPDDAFYDYAGTTYNLTKDGVAYHIIWMESFKCTIEDYSVLAHECLHATLDILDACGAPITIHNQETIAYSYQYIYENLMIATTKDWKKLNNFNI